MAEIKLKDIQSIGSYEREPINIPITILPGSTKTQISYNSEANLAQNKIVEYINKNQELTTLFDRRKAAEKALGSIDNTIRQRFNELILSDEDFKQIFDDLIHKSTFVNTENVSKFYY